MSLETAHHNCDAVGADAKGRRDEVAAGVCNSVDPGACFKIQNKNLRIGNHEPCAVGDGADNCSRVELRKTNRRNTKQKRQKRPLGPHSFEPPGSNRFGWKSTPDRCSYY